MIRRKKRPGDDVPDLPMDPMVDVVFQLLVFFLFSFQVRMLETVLTTQLSLARPPATQAAEPEDKRPVRLELLPDAKGQLTGLRVDGEPIAAGGLADALRQREPQRPPEKRRAELLPGGGLRYAEVVKVAQQVTESRWTVVLGSTAKPLGENRP